MARRDDLEAHIRDSCELIRETLPCPAHIPGFEHQGPLVDQYHVVRVMWIENKLVPQGCLRCEEVPVPSSIPCNVGEMSNIPCSRNDAAIDRMDRQNGWTG